MEQFKTIEEILSGGLSLFDKSDTAKSDRVLKSTKIEQAIYEDLCSDAQELSEYEHLGMQKLKTFDSLVNDVFQSVYGLNPKYTGEEDMSVLSKKFNKGILQHLMSDESYSAVKSVCEGKELPAIGATEEFTGQLLESLDTLMEKATGGKGKIDALDKMEQDKKELIEKLTEMLKKRDELPDGQRGATERKIVHTANRILSKEEQGNMYSNLIENNMRQNAAEIKGAVSHAAVRAKERAEDIQAAVLAWGDGNGDMQKNPVNTEILKRVAASNKLRYIARFLGRYKQMLNSKRQAGYTYGRGEKYDITCGNNISRALTSELAYLASPELVPLFIRKYQNKKLKQYRRREPEYKGKGDIIVCLDESGSTYGENSAYGMAIAMILYEICKVNNTSFALVHFASDCKTYCFRKNEAVSAEIVLECAETFLNGGTNFDNPLCETISLMTDGGFEKPDIVFITDGVCEVSDDVLKRFNRIKTETGAKLTGILLDRGESFSFTLEQFVDCIYRTSELLNDKIIENLIKERI